ncbi:MAG TPA: hypothetical protein VF796_28255 [Humisphaera sp.]
MSGRHLLEELARLDVRVRVDGHRLVLDAPRGVLTPSLTSAVVACKPELIAVFDNSVPSLTAPNFARDDGGGVRLDPPPCLRGLCLETAAKHGFPRVPLPHRPAEAVGRGESAWKAFVGTATPSDLAAVIAGLDEGMY